MAKAVQKPAPEGQTITLEEFAQQEGLRWPLPQGGDGTAGMDYESSAGRRTVTRTG